MCVKTPGGRNERNMSIQDYDEALSSGGKESKYIHRIKEKRSFVKGNGSRSRKKGRRGRWYMGKLVAFLTVIRFGNLDKSRAIDGCTPAPCLRWYYVSRGT